MRRVFEASARHDAEAVLALYDPASNGTPLGRSPDSAGSPTSTAYTTASVVSFASGPMNGVRSDPVWRHHVDIRAAVAAARECDRAVVAGKGTVRSRRGESIAENRVGDCLLQSFQSPIPVRVARSAGRRYTVSEKERAGDPLPSAWQRANPAGTQFDPRAGGGPKRLLRSRSSFRRGTVRSNATSRETRFS